MPTPPPAASAAISASLASMTIPDDGTISTSRSPTRKGQRNTWPLLW
jgi:hypothetical protein